VSLIAAVHERLVVLASADGSPSHVEPAMPALRGTASGVEGRFTNVSRIVVTADGRSLIVVNGVTDCRTKGGFEEGSYQPEIDQVVLETKARERVVGGSDFPVVNAKGVVAYRIFCDGEGVLGFTDLITGHNARRGALGESELPIESVEPLAWLSDGRTLFYAGSVRGETRRRYYFGRLWPLVLPEEEAFRRVADALEDGPDPATAALVNDTTIAFAQETSGRSQVRAWDVSSGRFRPDWGFQIPGAVGALATDRSGTHFLVVTRTQILYRWSVGDGQPTKLAEGVRAAAWLH
jgi:hypothetical protein